MNYSFVIATYDPQVAAGDNVEGPPLQMVGAGLWPYLGWDDGLPGAAEAAKFCHPAATLWRGVLVWPHRVSGNDANSASYRLLEPLSEQPSFLSAGEVAMAGALLPLTMGTSSPAYRRWITRFCDDAVIHQLGGKRAVGEKQGEAAARAVAGAVHTLKHIEENAGSSYSRRIYEENVGVYVASAVCDARNAVLWLVLEHGWNSVQTALANAIRKSRTWAREGWYGQLAGPNPTMLRWAYGPGNAWTLSSTPA